MKRQRRIDTFFQSQRETCTYYFLDWSTEKPKAIWLKEKPLGAKWESEVRWKEMKLFVTLGSSVSSCDVIERKKPTIDTSLLSLIKSNLQKCIRRQLTQKGLETAKRFMEWDMGHFLRRLSIIMMEDVILHESLPVLVWLMAAESKGFSLTKEMEKWLLSLVSYMCQEKRESYWSLGISNQDQSLLEKDSYFYGEAKKSQEKGMVFSLLLRKSYGGMQGDCIMIMDFVQRVCRGECIISHSAITLLKEEIKPIELDRIETCSVDFHCYPQLVMQLVRIFRNFTEKDLRRAIWDHNSRTNYRVLPRILPETERIKMNHSLKIWSSIRYKTLLIQKEFLMTCRNRYNYSNRVV